MAIKAASSARSRCFHARGTVFYAVLGPFLAMKPSGDVIAGLAPRHRQLLALFLLNPNTAVHRDRLIDLLWNGCPTKSAPRNLTTYIAQVRRRLSPRDPDLSPLHTLDGGYLLSVPPGSVDAAVFNHFAEQARIARENGDYHNAARMFENALSLWRGDALPAMRHVDELSAWAERLDEDRRAVTEDLFDVRLALGHHHEIVGGLAQWARRHPLRERPHRQLMLALHRSGRTHDASASYQRLRRTLVDRLGTEPSPDTQALHQRILTGDDLPSALTRLCAAHRPSRECDRRS
ncbi:AfsR/SARP family transcriptional regulator [Microbispora bryophytorum]|uniref:AfsR/SARP family transcriptional regulator n=1 Tax=Microbispora bryophytorum subsp. camponoti TaxID=1677852 RepID=A0ABR8L5C8_9ACTN|nr:AfsR/SARP family transcriptional regulator [Microbispora camponoti]MBD3146148.1 AfsR/SARP family transcriptional regulator [Microbispora camponoti]